MTGLLLLLLAAGALVAGAELFVDNLAATSRALGLSVLAVGLLLAGAEPEELLTAVLAALGGHGGLAAGDAVGANVTMLTAALGLAALVRPVPVGHRVRVYAVLSAVAGALAVLALLDGRVGRGEGALLLVAYAVLVGVVWRRERRPPALGELAELEQEEAEQEEDGQEGGGPGRGRVTPLLLAALGLVVITAGGIAAVAGATRVVASFDLRESAVGLTVLALATTAELFALVLTAARHDVAEVAVAGVVGSATYNALATLGGAALARPLRTGAVLAPAVAAAVLPLVVLLLARRGRLGRPAGGVLLLGYVGYTTVLLAR